MRKSGGGTSYSLIYRLFRAFKSLKPAFTLAEVLITLGIIGVVSAMTIPNLMAKYTQKSFVMQWRKTYSSLSQAVRLMQYDEEVILGGGSQADYEYELLTILSRHMKISKICHANKGVQEGCFPEAYRILSNKNVTYTNSMDTLMGGSTCASILSGGVICFDANIAIVDVNGFSKPNTIGRDIYSAVVNMNDYSVRPAAGHRSGYGPVDGVTLSGDKGQGTCGKYDTDYGWGCSKFYLHNMP